MVNEEGTNEGRNRMVDDVDRGPGVGHRAHGTFVIRGTCVIAVDVIRLDKSGKQDQADTEQGERG